ncbi:MAG: DUF4340 domain-containing protein [Oscillospiraceae bacterium]|nr:DUF4340 domain-containing protein [Oscillospiraceae bacterium]
MKKRSVVLIGLITVLAVVMLAYVLISNMPNPNVNRPQQPLNTQVLIADDDPRTVVALSYTLNGIPLAFEFNEIAYKWYLKGDRGFPVEQTILQYMSSAISKIMVERTVEESRDNFTEFGLDKPFLTITVTFKPEKEEAYTKTYHIGNLNTYNDQYYFNVAGTDTVYMIMSGLIPYFDYEFLDLAVRDTIPNFNLDAFTVKSCEINGVEIEDTVSFGKNISAVTLNNLIHYDRASEFDIKIDVKYVEKSNVTNTDGSMASSINVDHEFSFSINPTENYILINGSGLIYQVDSAKIEALLETT